MPAPMSEDDEDVLNATVVEPANKNKRSRKLVAKTFMDKDGFVGMFIFFLKFPIFFFPIFILMFI
jgi:hypothetical protein